MTYEQLFNIAAFECSAPMLKKLLEKIHLTNIDGEDMLNALFSECDLLSNNESAALRLEFTARLTHCKLVQDLTTEEYSIEGINGIQHLLLCYQVLEQSGRCIMPRRENVYFLIDDDKHFLFFALLDQARQTIDEDTLSKCVSNICLSDDERAVNFNTESMSIEKLLKMKNYK